MDHKAIKGLLLDARKAIADKDFPAVKRSCQEILNVDKNNYNALVFLGYASQELQEHEEAITSFMTAINISPKQLLAWQGLRAFYEKEKPLVHAEELSVVYLKLLELYADDSKKQVETYTHLGTIYYKELKDNEKAVDFLRKGLNISGSELNSDNATLWSTLFLCLSSQSILSSEDLNLLETAVDKFYEGKSKGLASFNSWKFDVFDKYFELLLTERRFVKIVNDAKKMLILYPDEEAIAALQLHAFISSCFDGDHLILEDLESVFKCISVGNEKMFSYVYIATGANFFINQNWIEARDNLLQGIKMNTGKCWEGWLLLCWVLERFYDGMAIEIFAVEGLKLIWPTFNENLRKHFKSLFWLSLGKGLAFQKSLLNFEKAIAVFEKAMEDDLLKLEALFYEGVTFLKMKEFDKVKKNLEVIKTSTSDCNNAFHYALHGLLLLEQNDLEAAKQSLMVAIELSPEQDDWLVHLGIIHEKLLDHSTAYEYYLKAAKSNPYNATTFLKLGHHYRDIKNDLRKALKFYKFAFDLNKTDEEIGISLSSIYQQISDEDAHMNLLQLVTSNSAAGSHKWAWIRLGLLLLKKENPNEAIRALQSALRSDPQDSECWQCLGEAYMMRGSYTTALKAFGRALELNPQLLYCIYQTANIKLSLGFYKEAAKSFTEIIEIVPDYVPALKGLGQSYFAQAQISLQQSMSKNVISLCEAALAQLAGAIAKQPNFTCVWKLIGDTCTLLGQLPHDIPKVNVPVSFLKNPAYFSDSSTLDKLSVLKLGERCYLTAVHCASNNSSLWHDIGINYYYQALAQSEANDKRKCLNYGSAAMKKAIQMNGRNTSHWNGLGVIAAMPELKNYRLAQHSFIKALIVEPNNYEVWNNLGNLYLINGNINLANQAFAISQSIAPSYVNSWIGQAIIAENLKHVDAMDLFRHCASIGNHIEGYIGYASYVCSTLLNPSFNKIEASNVNSEKVALATDCLLHFTDLVTNNTCAHNMLGLLLERQKLLHSSRCAFEKAINLLQSAMETKLMDNVQCNYARVLRKLGNLKESITAASSVKEVEFYNHCGLADSYYKLNCFQESSSAYVFAMQSLAQSEEEKSNLLVAMSSMAYTLSGPEEAKTLLFQSFQMKPACVQGLLALSALGFLLNDSALVDAAVEELKPWEFDENFRLDISHLKACQAVLQDNHSEARNIYCKSIHQWPNCFSSWLMLAKYLLKHSIDIKLANCCASAASKLCSAPSIDMFQLLSLCCFSMQMERKGLKMTEKLIHSYPGEYKYRKLLSNSV